MPDIDWRTLVINNFMNRVSMEDTHQSLLDHGYTVDLDTVEEMYLIAAESVLEVIQTTAH